MTYNKSLVPEIELSSVISDIASGPFGSSIKVSSLVTSGIPLLDGSNLKGFKVTDNITKFVTDEKAHSLERSIAHRGDVVSTIRGTLGQIAYVPEDSKYMGYLCSQSQFRITFDKEKVYPPFIVFYFHTREGQQKLLSFASQVGVPALTQPLKNFPRIKIRLPDYLTQKRIAKVVELLNEKIDNNNKINDNLFQQAQALYKDRFIDMHSFNGTMPSDWHLGTVSEIIELHDSKRIPLSGRERADLEKIYPYYGATSIMDYVDKYLFDGIYLLLGEDGTVVDDKGFPILQYVEGKFWVNNHAHIITGKNGFSVELLYLLFSLTSVQSIVTGAVQQKISQANLNKVQIIIPSRDALAAFDATIQPLFAQIRNLHIENDNLIVVRDTLLPQLMSGELSVTNLIL